MNPSLEFAWATAALALYGLLVWMFARAAGRGGKPLTIILLIGYGLGWVQWTFVVIQFLTTPTP